MISLDNTDKQIVNLLQQNSKVNIKEIALKIGLTQTPTYERIKRLEKSGIIKNYVAILDKEKAGFNVEVFCQVSLLVHSKELITKFEHAINKIDEVVECFHVAGNYDYLLKVIVKDMKSYQSFLKNKLSVLDSVSNVQSTFVMTSTKEYSIIKLI
ncbi:Lrp/AsnC family transcriptional regulator [Lutibacter sp.]|uniref:Lrp/AsnC family transcriptional regulator n=1 Tax=Lutibacter sp. TaxID=1925666 RepID=UPI002732959A|nr:Lrp/AsnC family transcriptional regulator [Lutibacter sp.]MDP3314304.1 Lrp/AsnC family transcriptional regulator [Lutibacter sp.]